MNKLKGKRELKRLKELIREYKRQGYEIYANYLDFERPRNIGEFVPDLIVRKGDQEVIIEVTSDESLRHLQDKLKRLSEYAADHDRTRFDLIITNPRPIRSREEKLASCKYLLEDLQRSLLREIRKQYDKENFQVSFLILCQLLESLLKELALKKKIVEPSKKISIRQLNSILFESKALSSDDFLYVKALLNYRNRIIHYVEKIEKDRLREYIDFVSSLLKTVR